MSDTKKIILAILSTILFIGIIFSLLGRVNESETEPVVATPSANVTPVSVRQEAEEAFVEACIGEDAVTGYCQCAWDFLERTYGYDEIMDTAAGYLKTGDIPFQLVEADKYCAE